ncbi:MAG: cytochrome b/b6 domain-containing protein [Mariprofundaceae bacterium]|nr:cytochrome b/b6 domain-containing protein [Mariprofundaceae bacterium]
MKKESTLLVWGKFTRFFHWSLVSLFIVSYLSSRMAEDDVHAFAGYALVILLLARLVWGFVGSDAGRFSRFFFSLHDIFTHAKEMLKNKPKHYVGHSPVGSLMVFALLFFLSLTVALGLVSQAWSEYEGPFWMMGMMPSDVWGRMAENGHEFLGDALLVLIALHLLGVMLACVQHRENLVRSMFSGYKKH